MPRQVRPSKRGNPGRPEVIWVVSFLPDAETWKLEGDWREEVRQEIRQGVGPDDGIIILPPGAVLDRISPGGVEVEIIAVEDGDDEDDIDDGAGDGGAAVPVGQ